MSDGKRNEQPGKPLWFIKHANSGRRSTRVLFDCGVPLI